MLRLTLRAPCRPRAVTPRTPGRPRSQHAAASSSSSPVSPESTTGQQKARETALAEALAREEAAVVRAKALRELRERTRASVHALNSAAYADIEPRLVSLQAQLASVPAAKVQQLDEQLEEFLFSAMKLPASETAHAPWARDGPRDGAGNRQVYSDSKHESRPGKDPVQVRSTSGGSVAAQFPRLRPTPDYKPYSEQELFLRHMAHVTRCGSLGSRQHGVYEPSRDTAAPKSAAELDLAALMAAECHLGHARSLWRPSTQPFIYGEYNGVHLIDLNHTLVALRKAARVAREVAAKGGIILYVGTSRHPEQQHALEEAARRSNAYCVTHRWIPGTITNFTEVARQIAGPQTTTVDMADSETGKTYTAADGGLLKPDLIVVMNPVANRNCIGESIKSRIPTIGLCDTNMEPSLLTYPIPCNDDSMRASSLVLGVLSRAASEGVAERHRLYAQYSRAKKDASVAASAPSV